MKKQILTGLAAGALTLAFVSRIVGNVGFYTGKEDSSSESASVSSQAVITAAAYDHFTPEVKTQAIYSNLSSRIIKATAVKQS